MVNESFFSVRGYIATQPKSDRLKDGTRTFSARVGWTPRLFSRSTGEWTDQPTSFISVQCYGRIAENAANCVRRGDPVTLTGRLRVREYTDQAGVKRNVVEVTAESFGHDMSRGTSNYVRTPQHQEQTAAEYQQAMAAAGRSPLPGDVEAMDHGDDEEPVPGDADELADGDQPGLQLADRDGFDDAQNVEPEGRDAAPEPVGATAERREIDPGGPRSRRGQLRSPAEAATVAS